MIRRWRVREINGSATDPSVAFGDSSPQGGERLRWGRRLLTHQRRPPPCGGQIRAADQGVGLGLGDARTRAPLKPTCPTQPAQPSLLAKREATLRRPRPGKRGVARRAIPSAPKSSTPAADVGFRGGGEGMWPPLQRPGERECNGSGLVERVTPTETEGSRVRMSLRHRPVERVRPLVDRLEPEPNPASVAGTGSDDVGESSVRSNPIERWASRSAIGDGRSAPVADWIATQLQPIELPQLRHL